MRRRSTAIWCAASIRSSRRSPCRTPSTCPPRPVRAKPTNAASRSHGIDAVVAKNSGGSATYGKIAAARALGIEVILLRRPPPPDVPAVATVDEAVAAVAHRLGPGEKRGE